MNKLYFCLIVLFISCSTKPTIDNENLTAELNSEVRTPASNVNDSTVPSDRSRLQKVSENQGSYYFNKVQPIFNNRCVVCHSCNEAPCSLYLNSYQGLFRGAMTDTKLLSTVFADQPVRLKDAKTLLDWHKKGFSSVINFDVSKESTQNNILFRYINQGNNYNTGAFDYQLAEKFLENGKVCPANPKDLDSYFNSMPFVGMPFALPALTHNETEIIRKWVEGGSLGPSLYDQNLIEKPSHSQPLIEWEQFLNELSPKSRLTARYLYEHMFISHIHFENTPEDEFYEIVRSRTQYPETISEIVTERPYDDPNIELFYYRFKKVTEAIVRKTHITMELNNIDLSHWQNTFIKSDWGLETIQDVNYESKNPFEYFKQIPAFARYSFLIEKSYGIVNAMIRGSVCTGKRATYAIRDHFWVLFLDPNFDPSVKDPEIGEREWVPLSASKEKSESIISSLIRPDTNKFNYNTNMIWRGNGNNPNALLSIFRHELSASVHRGLIGKIPNTIWVLNFSNFERLYYNLVVEFKPWGSTAHQYATWKSMTLHRQEAEERFLMFFSPEIRSTIRKRWSEDLSEYASHILTLNKKEESPEEIEKNITPVENLMQKITSEFPKPVIENSNPYFLKASLEYRPLSYINSIEKWEHEINYINTLSKPKFAKYLPNIVYIRVAGKAYSLITHRAFKFNDMILGENLAYDPQGDTLTIVRGLFGDRPELFIDLSLIDAGLFLKRLMAVSQMADWIEIKKTFGVRRNDSKIWTMLDWFHKTDKETNLLESGIIDMNRYDMTTW